MPIRRRGERTTDYRSDIEPNLFYCNAEPEDPQRLAESVFGELGFLEAYLRHAIDNTQVDRYGLVWERDLRLRYTLFPSQRLRIVKPGSRILLRVDASMYDPERPIVKSGDQRLLKTQGVAQHPRGVVLSLVPGEDVRTGETLYYGVSPAEWEHVARGLGDRPESLVDDQGHRHRVLQWQDRSDHVLADIEPSIAPGATLRAGDNVLEYGIVTQQPLSAVQFRDARGDLPCVSIDGRALVIEAYRPIVPPLSDDSGSLYKCREEPRTRSDEGVWIEVMEEEKETASPDEEQTGRVDIFFELVSASDREVWEKPDLSGRSTEREGKIRVLKVDREEQRLLLDREPRTPVVYPPRNTYQLSRQLRAVSGLMRFPSPDHRGLLRLFEENESAQWETPVETFRESGIDWIFLTDGAKDGTLEQRQFVLKALNTPDFALLEGPPGSGKTTAISELICQLLGRHKRVLLAASTHVAVDNVLEKLEARFAAKGGPIEHGIAPLRIGLEERVGEDLLKYQIDTRRSALEDLLRGEPWFAQLPEKSRTDVVDEFLARSSNLVCGTTIGILRYPSFRKDPSELDYVIPEFDCLIIDEASKTTFQEFLVPARHCRKWILVGDVHQLSPFTDTLHLRVNLDGILPDEALKKALVVYLKLVFGRSTRSRRTDQGVSRAREKSPPPFIYVDRTAVISALYDLVRARLLEDRGREPDARRLDGLRVAFVMQSAPSEEPPDGIVVLTEDSMRKADHASSLWECDLVFAEELVYRRKRGSFPASHVLVDVLRREGISVHDFRHRHWLNAGGGEPYAYRVRGGYVRDPEEVKEDVLRAVDRSWAGELAWRIRRLYELREVGGRVYDFYHASRETLLPPWSWGESRRVHGAVRRASRVALPSILTSLQQGVTQDDRADEYQTVMSHGLPPDTKKPRYERLSFQHRMHPEISAIPRDIFYRGHALHDVKEIQSERMWGGPEPFPERPERVVWIDVEGQTIRNTNRREAETILSEMDRFVRWARTRGPEREGLPWRVIILSFYEGQRRFIRDQLRKRDPEQARKETQFMFDGVDVRNYTVDRVQGQEGAVVFLSMVQTRRVGFMDSPNRLNVAITRARYKLVIVGARQFFLEQNDSQELRLVAEKASPPSKTRWT